LRVLFSVPPSGKLTTLKGEVTFAIVGFGVVVKPGPKQSKCLIDLTIPNSKLASCMQNWFRFYSSIGKTLHCTLVDQELRGIEGVHIYSNMSHQIEIQIAAPIPVR
jgi:hypothetical protein